MKISVNNNCKEEKNISVKSVESVARQVVEELQNSGEISNNANVEISIALVDESRIAELNQQYRQHNGPTDVLSFSYENNEIVLEGELILCPVVIKKNALEDEIEFREELSKNIIHGILHIIGYEHGEKMFSLQNNILNKNKNEY